VSAKERTEAGPTARSAKDAHELGVGRHARNGTPRPGRGPLRTRSPERWSPVRARGRPERCSDHLIVIRRAAPAPPAGSPGRAARSSSGSGPS
jgi:hypothetical protein